MTALWLRRCANARATHAVDARAGLVRASVIEIWSCKIARGPAAIDASEEQRGRGFEYGKRRALEQIGKTDEDGFFAAPNGQRQRFVRIEIDVEARRAAFAIETGVDTLK